MVTSSRRLGAKEEWWGKEEMLSELWLELTGKRPPTKTKYRWEDI
jgi:hypothetical protein